jgi:DNA-binding CsgD family transcriptional regulator
MLLGYFLLPREAAVREMSIVELNDPVNPNVSGDAHERGKRRFNARCEHVASAYLLSDREADVLYLLAKGRNAAYIAKKLFIVEGTVNTHIWHIYRKLEVHSQQELMDLVDSYVVHEDGRVENQPKREREAEPAKVEARPKRRMSKAKLEAKL